MKVIYKTGAILHPGDQDVYNGIQEINKNNYQSALNHFEKISLEDNEHAMLFKAIIYFYGFDLPKRNPSRAIDLFKKIALKWNNPLAQYFLGLIYTEGDNGILQDIDTGIYWFLLSAKNKWVFSMAHIAYAYDCGKGFEEDHFKANEWCMAIEKNQDKANKPVRNKTLYLFGSDKFELNLTDVDQNSVTNYSADNTRLNTFIQCSSLLYNNSFSNMPKIQRKILFDILINKKPSNVALCKPYITELYTSDMRIKEDEYIPNCMRRAIHSAMEGAVNGCSSSCEFIASQLDIGLYVEHDFEEALEWYKKARALTGNSSFCNGFNYFTGITVEKVRKEALNNFQSINHIHHQGYSYLFMGNIYKVGAEGVPRSYKKSYECYEKAFEINNLIGATHIALLYLETLDKKQEDKKICEWFKKAAAAGCPVAIASLEIIRNRGFQEGTRIIISDRKSLKKQISGYIHLINSNQLLQIQ